MGQQMIEGSQQSLPENLSDEDVAKIKEQAAQEIKQTETPDAKE